MSKNTNITNLDLNPFPISKETGDALIKPSANSAGHAIKDILDGIFHIFLDPVRKFNLQREQNLENFKQEIQQASSQIPEKFKDDSRLGIVLKTIEDSRYQLNDNEIRALFVKLISSTLDKRKNENITPIFSTIISNMMPSEATLLERIYKNTSSSLVPVIEVIVKHKTLGDLVLNKYLIFGVKSVNNTDLQINLLEANNLVVFHKDIALTAELFKFQYDYFIDKFDINLVPQQNVDNIEFKKSYYSLTELGKHFCKVVFE